MIKRLMFALLLSAMTFTSVAEETVYQVDEVSVINFGDGRLLFRQINEKKTPLQGDHRIIDGYRSEYLLAQFKDGMYHGTYQHFKSNKLKEGGTYKDGRKNGTYKEYFSNGKSVKKEAEYLDGKLNGRVSTYFTNGALESQKEYAMSVEQGYERKYDYETGLMTAERNYKDGVQHGTQIINYTSNIGNYVEKSNYVNGKRVGEYTETFADGMIKTKGTFNAKGQKDGEWLERDGFATKDRFSGRKITYKNGEKISTEEIKDFEKFQRK